MAIYYTVYRTTNLVNGKIYIGAHKTDNLNDNYLGSRLALARAIDKYGEENFSRETLYKFSSANNMFNMEADLVNEDFVARLDTYNIKLGGRGGWDFVLNNNLHINKNNQGGYKLHQKCLNDPEFAKKIYSKRSEDLLKMHESGKMSHLYFSPSSPNQQKAIINSHTPAANAKREATFKKNQITRIKRKWIFNTQLKITKQIKITELDSFLSLGWKLGRRKW